MVLGTLLVAIFRIKMHMKFIKPLSQNLVKSSTYFVANIHLCHTNQLTFSILPIIVLLPSSNCSFNQKQSNYPPFKNSNKTPQSISQTDHEETKSHGLHVSYHISINAEAEADAFVIITFQARLMIERIK